MTVLSERLKDARKKVKLSQGVVAKGVGMTARGYGHYELGTSVPDDKKLRKIAKILKVKADFLISAQIRDKIQKDSKDEKAQVKKIKKKIEEYKECNASLKDVITENQDKIIEKVKEDWTVKTTTDNNPTTLKIGEEKEPISDDFFYFLELLNRYFDSVERQDTELIQINLSSLINYINNILIKLLSDKEFVLADHTHKTLCYFLNEKNSRKLGKE